MDEQNQQQTLPPQQPPIPLQNLNPVPQPPQQRTWIKWVLVLVLVATLSSGATYLVLKSQSPKQPSPQIVQPTPTPTISQPSPTPDLYTEGTRSATTNWKIYTNTIYSYSLKYPPTYKPLLGGVLSDSNAQKIRETLLSKKQGKAANSSAAQTIRSAIMPVGN